MFNFALSPDELVDDDELNFGGNATTISTKEDPISVPQDQDSDSLEEVDVLNLLDNLPGLISYTPLIIPIASDSAAETITLHRRDLFDARFQLISGENDHESDDARDSTEPHALSFIDNPSDLVPGVYEGGMKTWECSLDLVDHLHSELPRLRKENPSWPSGTRVAEIGCGTAVPTLYLLHELFHLPPSTNTRETIIHLQDYNRAVLELVTLPNILLTWYNSPLSADYRASPDLDRDETPPEDPPKRTGGAELTITPALLTAFTSSLAARNIRITLFAGSWSAFLNRTSPSTYDVILTSETVYRAQSLPSLIALLKSASHHPHYSSTVDDQLASLQLSPTTQSPTPTLILVAAKVLYFGVGGSIADFERALATAGARARCVWDSSKKGGVGRKVLEVQFDES